MTAVLHFFCAKHRFFLHGYTYRKCIRYRHYTASRSLILGLYLPLTGTFLFLFPSMTVPRSLPSLRSWSLLTNAVPKTGKRDQDLDDFPARIEEHKLSQEKLAARYPEDYKELPEVIYKRLAVIPETFIADEHHFHVYASKANDGTIVKAARLVHTYELPARLSVTDGPLIPKAIYGSTAVIRNSKTTPSSSTTTRRPKAPTIRKNSSPDTPAWSCRMPFRLITSSIKNGATSPWLGAGFSPNKDSWRS